jgi:hypothetical protein
LVVDLAAVGEPKLAQVGRVEPDLADTGRGDERDVDEVDLEQERTRPRKRDDGDVGDETALDKLDLRGPATIGG